MKKKRFVKLCMGQLGISRNEATAFSYFVVRDRAFYFLKALNKYRESNISKGGAEK